MIRCNGGWDRFKMIEVEKYPCNDKHEAERRENEIMKELKASMNTIKSFLTEEERKENRNEYLETNKEKIQEYKKEYYDNNKDYYKDYYKEYNKTNKEKINQQNKEYRENNKKIITKKQKEKVTCKCGCKVVKRTLKQHERTKNILI
jgi:hypothetical protein